MISSMMRFAAMAVVLSTCAAFQGQGMIREGLGFTACGKSSLCPQSHSRRAAVPSVVQTKMAFRGEAWNHLQSALGLSPPGPAESSNGAWNPSANPSSKLATSGAGNSVGLQSGDPATELSSMLQVSSEILLKLKRMQKERQELEQMEQEMREKDKQVLERMEQQREQARMEQERRGREQDPSSNPSTELSSIVGISSEILLKLKQIKKEKQELKQMEQETREQERMAQEKREQERVAQEKREQEVRAQAEEREASKRLKTLASTKLRDLVDQGAAVAGWLPGLFRKLEATPEEKQELPVQSVSAGQRSDGSRNKWSGGGMMMFGMRSDWSPKRVASQADSAVISTAETRVQTSYTAPVESVSPSQSAPQEKKRWTGGGMMMGMSSDWSPSRGQRAASQASASTAETREQKTYYTAPAQSVSPIQSVPQEKASKKWSGGGMMMFGMRSDWSPSKSQQAASAAISAAETGAQKTYTAPVESVSPSQSAPQEKKRWTGGGMMMGMSSDWSSSRTQRVASQAAPADISTEQKTYYTAPAQSVPQQKALKKWSGGGMMMFGMRSDWSPSQSQRVASQASASTAETRVQTTYTAPVQSESPSQSVPQEKALKKWSGGGMMMGMRSDWSPSNSKTTAAAAPAASYNAYSAPVETSNAYSAPVETSTPVPQKKWTGGGMMMGMRSDWSPSNSKATAAPAAAAAAPAASSAEQKSYNAYAAPVQPSVSQQENASKKWSGGGMMMFGMRSDWSPSKSQRVSSQVSSGSSNNAFTTSNAASGDKRSYTAPVPSAPSAPVGQQRSVARPGPMLFGVPLDWTPSQQRNAAFQSTASTIIISNPAQAGERTIYIAPVQSAFAAAVARGPILFGTQLEWSPRYRAAILKSTEIQEQRAYYTASSQSVPQEKASKKWSGGGMMMFGMRSDWSPSQSQRVTTSAPAQSVYVDQRFAGSGGGGDGGGGDGGGGWSAAGPILFGLQMSVWCPSRSGASKLASFSNSSLIDSDASRHGDLRTPWGGERLYAAAAAGAVSRGPPLFGLQLEWCPSSHYLKHGDDSELRGNISPFQSASLERRSAAAAGRAGGQTAPAPARMA